MRKNKKERKSRSSRERGGYAIRNVPDAIGLLIKGISCRASGSWAENLFHRVLMSAEKRYQWGGEREKEGIGGGRLRSPTEERRESDAIMPMLLRIDFLISRILNYFRG